MRSHRVRLPADSVLLFTCCKCALLAAMGFLGYFGTDGSMENVCFRALAMGDVNVVMTTALAEQS